MKITPPDYVAEVQAQIKRETAPKTLFECPVLKIERRFNSRFSHPEYHFTFKNPFRRHKAFFDPVYDSFPLGRPAKLIVFGAIPHQKGAWHARSGTVYYDVNAPADFPKNLGYPETRNLANY